MVADAYAKTPGVKLFLSGSMFDIPIKTESTFQLESSIHGHALSVGEMLAFHLHNDSNEEATVVLKVSGYGVDVADESCVNDPEQPVIADIRTRGLQRPVGQVLTSLDWNRRLESGLIEGDGGVSITEDAFNQLSPDEQAALLGAGATPQPSGVLDEHLARDEQPSSQRRYESDHEDEETKH